MRRLIVLPDSGDCQMVLISDLCLDLQRFYSSVYQGVCNSSLLAVLIGIVWRTSGQAC